MTATPRWFDKGADGSIGFYVSTSSWVYSNDPAFASSLGAKIGTPELLPVTGSHALVCPLN